MLQLIACPNSDNHWSQTYSRIASYSNECRLPATLMERKAVQPALLDEGKANHNQKRALLSGDKMCVNCDCKWFFQKICASVCLETNGMGEETISDGLTTVLHTRFLLCVPKPVLIIIFWCWMLWSFRLDFFFLR